MPRVVPPEWPPEWKVCTKRTDREEAGAAMSAIRRAREARCCPVTVATRGYEHNGWCTVGAALSGGSDG